MTDTGTRKFTIGDPVRLSEQLEADWAAGRIAVGGTIGQLTGEVIGYADKEPYCGTCEYEDKDCTDPGYIVKDIDGDDGVFADGTIYAEHELRIRP